MRSISPADYCMCYKGNLKENGKYDPLIRTACPTWIQYNMDCRYRNNKGIRTLCNKIPSLLVILIFIKLLLGVVHIILQYLDIIVNNKYNYSYLLNIGDILPFVYLLSFLNT